MWRWLRTLVAYILLMVYGQSRHDRFVQNLIKQCKKRKNRGHVDGITEELDEVSDLPENCLGDTHFVGFTKDGRLASFRMTTEGNAHTHTTVSLEFPGIGKYTHNDSRALSFGTGKLRFEMLDPMKRWKISFHGSIGSHVGGGDIERLHASVSLYWQCLADPFDHYTSISRWHLAKNHSDQLWGKTSWKNMFDKERVWYEQWGEMRGKLEIEGQGSQFVRLQGFRSRQIGIVHEMSLVSNHIIQDGGGNFIMNGCVYESDKNEVERFGYTTIPIGQRVALDGSDLRLDFKTSTLKYPTFEFPMKIWGQGSFLTIDKGLERENVIEDQSGPVNTHVYFSTFTINGRSAHGVHCRSTTSIAPYSTKDEQIYELISKEQTNRLTLHIDMEHCRNPSIVGGKFANLSILLSLKYSIPNAFCVTTKAFLMQLEASDGLQTCQHRIVDMIRDKSSHALPSACSEAVAMFTDTELCPSVAAAIEDDLLRTFGPQYEDKSFAVRSSGVSEDGGEASYAGQMETILEVKGLENILQAVRKCWASSICYEVVEYRRQNGQPATEPIAVIIQEMVDADTAGVLFTNDPLTGNSSFMVVNAVSGLGDKVVAGNVTPDSITVCRTKGPDQLELTMKSVSERSNQGFSVVNKNARNTNIDRKYDTDLCITDEQINDLCRLGLQVEDSFGNPQDIEWAISKGHIYILQSRPITTLVKETDEELMHEFDSPTAMDNECLTRYNFGEVFPGAISTLTSDLHIMAAVRAMYEYTKLTTCVQAPWYASKFAISFTGKVFFNMTFITATADLQLLDKNSAHILFTGRIIDEISTEMVNIYRGKRLSFLQQCKLLFAIFTRMPMQIKLFKNWMRKVDTFTIGSERTTVSELYNSLDESRNIFFTVFLQYMYVISYSSAPYGMMYGLLQAEKSVDSDATNEDISVLLANCQNIVSADVPRAMERLALVIKHSTFMSRFLQLPDDECHDFLMNAEDALRSQYEEFMNKNSHRCIKEFELLEKSWGSQPATLICALKTLVKNPIFSRTADDVSEEPNNRDLKSPVSWLKKYFIRMVLLNKVKAGVAFREAGKSAVIKTLNVFKKAYWRLADLMVRDGRLPEDKLLFFLTHREIGSLIETRSAVLVRKAKNRMRIFRKQDSLEHEITNFGLPVALQEHTGATTEESSTMVCRGLPVGRGIATGIARVVTRLDDAKQIQPGDILICRYTDIGWSPYFPMISGIVTEIGGLISHGAVIAREVGLPCVVNVSHATRIFKSGERVRIDGLGGTITKLTD